MEITRLKSILPYPAPSDSEGGGGSTAKPSDVLQFSSAYNKDAKQTIKKNYDLHVKFNQDLKKTFEEYKGSKHFSEDPLVISEMSELENLVKRSINLRLDLLKNLIKTVQDPNNAVVTLEEPKNITPKVELLRLAVIKKLENVKIAIESYDTTNNVVIGDTISPPSPPPPPPPPSPPEVRLKKTNIYRPTLASLGIGAGKSYGDYKSYFPPLAGPQRSPEFTKHDANATTASPSLKAEKEVELATLNLQLELHPTTPLKDSTFMNGLLFLINAQFVQKKIPSDGAYFQMLQFGLGLSLQEMFQIRQPFDISIHGYFFEWGAEALKKKEFREYTRNGWFPFVQTGICGGYDLRDLVSLQFCGDWRRDGYSQNFKNMWGASGDSINFYILSASLFFNLFESDLTSND